MSNVTDFQSRSSRSIIRTTSTTSTTSTTTKKNTQDDAWGLLKDAFLDALGRKMPKIAEEDIQRFLDQGMQTVVILWALDAAAAAPRPSWAYCRAILQRCLAEGCLDAEGWQRRNQAWAERPRRSAQTPYKNPALDYPQRDYAAHHESFFTNLEEN